MKLADSMRFWRLFISKGIQV